MNYAQLMIPGPCSEGEKGPGAVYPLIVDNRDSTERAFVVCPAHPKSEGATIEAVEKTENFPPTLVERLGSFCTGCALNPATKASGGLDGIAMGGA